MSGIKNAVVVGKVTIPAPRKEIVPAKKPRPQAGTPKPEQKKTKREDPFAAKNANAQMLQELQYVKKQLRTTQEALSASTLAMAQLRADVVEFLAILPLPPVGSDLHSDPGFQALGRAIGLSIVLGS